MRYQERLLDWSKKHKKKLTLHTSIVATITGIFLLSSNMWSQTDLPVVEKKDTILTASFVGDMMFSRHVESIIAEKGYDYLFAYSDPYFKVSDFSTGNFKHPLQISGKEQPPNEDQQLNFSTTPETIDALVERNFKSVSIANNNIYDYGYLGFRNTVNYFNNDERIEAAGFMNDLEDLESAVFHTYGDMTIATLGASDVVAANSGATTFRPGIMPLDRPELLMQSILKASEQADLVIVHAHWGEAYDTHISAKQRELAKAMSHAGADVIIGHYPHVLAPVEVYNDTIIFYSLGNFIFDQGWSRTKQTALAQYRLYDDGSAEVELVPFVIREGQVRPVPKHSLQRVSIERMLSKKLAGSWSKENGNIVIPLNHERVLSNKGG